MEYISRNLYGWRIGGNPTPIHETPPVRNGFHFVCSAINEDGDVCETWQKKWSFLGSTILYETHGKLCSCSYCTQFDKRRGIVLPLCRCWNSWRIFYWRKPKWPCELSCIRFALPRYPFIWWKCRYCRDEERRRAMTCTNSKLRIIRE